MANRRVPPSARSQNLRAATGPNMEALARQSLISRPKSPKAPRPSRMGNVSASGNASRAVNRWDEEFLSPRPPPAPRVQPRQSGPFTPYDSPDMVPSRYRTGPDGWPRVSEPDVSESNVRQPTPYERDVLGGSWPLESNKHQQWREDQGFQDMRETLSPRDRVDYREWDETYMRPGTRRALEKAYSGDDSDLFGIEGVPGPGILNPTPTIDEDRPRSVMASYDSASETLRVRFRPQNKYPRGAVYEYYGVPKNVWRNMRRWKSVGRNMNAGKLNYPYAYNPDL